MSDLEMMKACADAMGIDCVSITDGLGNGSLLQKLGIAEPSVVRVNLYDPLHDDAQAMALVKRLGLWLESAQDCWHVHSKDDMDIYHDSIDLNRAIVECVAKLQSPTAPPQ